MSQQENKTKHCCGITHVDPSENKEGHYINYPILSGEEQISFLNCMSCASKFVEIKQSTLCVS